MNISQMRGGREDAAADRGLDRHNLVVRSTRPSQTLGTKINPLLTSTNQPPSAMYERDYIDYRISREENIYYEK